MIEYIDAGVVPYVQSLEWQKRLAGKRRRNTIPDQLILLEHPPIFTFGRRDSSGDLLVSEEKIHRLGMEIFHSDRGGLVTYHGPGQLVGYLIFSVKTSIPRFVWKIEETLIRLLERFHLEGTRSKGYPGVWIGKKKIAALGLHMERGISTHGFSLNVNCDLKPFRYIHPCGIHDRDVTSLEKELGWSPSLRDVKHLLLEELASVFATNVSLEGIAPTPPE